jgi:hypothetical protein
MFSLLFVPNLAPLTATVLLRHVTFPVLVAPYFRLGHVLSSLAALQNFHVRTSPARRARYSHCHIGTGSAAIRRMLACTNRGGG